MGGGWCLWWWWCLVSVVLGIGQTWPMTTLSDAESVNVISMENMDALLKLRLGPDAVLQANKASNKTEGLSQGRHRRAATTLCQRDECICMETYGWLNVTCAFNSYETVELKSGSLPNRTLEISLEDIGTLHIHPMAFFNTMALKGLNIKRVKNVKVHSSAFYNINAAAIHLELHDCKDVVFEDRSFKNLNGSVVAKISDCNNVKLGNTVFFKLSSLTVSNVPKLELVEDTFAPGRGTQYIMEIVFQNVTFNVIPRNVFSSAHEISFIDCRIGKISRSAFNATEISRVYISNTNLNVLESGTFSERTFIVELELRNVNILLIESSVVLTAVTNLTIDSCTINEIRGGAFNATVANIQLINNNFTIIRRHAFLIHQWSNVIIKSNTLDHLDPDAFSFAQGLSGSKFIFSDNAINRTEVGSLGFIPTDSYVALIISGNYLGTPCSCNLHARTTDLVTSTELGDTFYKTSYCKVTDWLAWCLLLKEGYISMSNYTLQICSSDPELKCEQSSHRINPQDYNFLGDWSQVMDNERRLLSFIILTALSGVCFILIVVLAMWIKRKGLVGRVISQFFQSSSLVATASISRINIHEYAEIQNLQNQTQIIEESDEEELVPIDDKATQTLPEELTQDLLQSLREKLDDPDNYREAREMIEHLYDLIKVEESCNNQGATLLEEDNLYAEVRPRTRPRTRMSEVTSVGTRSPSLDKLDPVHYLPRPTVANEYAEPRDTHVSAHVYCELPGNVPDVLVTGTSNLLANRPLPETPGASHH